MDWESYASKTYKIKAIDDSMEHAVYFTVAGNWLFVNCKSMSSFQWVTALMTSYNRQLEHGIPVTQVIADMKETFDPNGSYLTREGKMPSLVHHLGILLERHHESV